MPTFKAATTLFERYPELRIGVLRVSLPAALEPSAEAAAQGELTAAHGAPAVGDFGAWHEAFRWFGSKPKKYRCSAEALLLRVASGGVIPSILPVVDLYNAASIRSGLPIGGDDLAKVQGDVLLSFARGDEVFTEASGRESTPRKGEVIYRDDAAVLCRRWNWRESAATILSSETRELVLYIEALTGAQDLSAPIAALAEGLTEVLGATRVDVAILDKVNSAVDLETMALSASDHVGEPPVQRGPQQQSKAGGAPGQRDKAEGKRRSARSGDAKGFWADSMAGEILEHIERNKAVLGPVVARQGILVYDEKTPSGQIHVGSSRGWILHDVIARALRERGAPGVFVLSSDDMDPYDKPSAGLDRAQWDQHLGKPFRHIPSPVPGYEHYGDYYFSTCTEIFDRFSIECGLESTGQLYEDGAFDPSIQIALDRAEDIQRVYADLYPDAAGASRLPFNPLCEQCGRIGTTRALSWDSARGMIRYECRSDLMGYTDPTTREKVFIPGCGFQGERSPFSGGGKFPWKVEWAAKWITKGVIAEWAGKAHFSAGGARTAASCPSEIMIFG